MPVSPLKNLPKQPNRNVADPPEFQRYDSLRVVSPLKNLPKQPNRNVGYFLNKNIFIFCKETIQRYDLVVLANFSMGKEHEVNRNVEILGGLQRYDLAVLANFSMGTEAHCKS